MWLYVKDPAGLLLWEQIGLGKELGRNWDWAELRARVKGSPSSKSVFLLTLIWDELRCRLQDVDSE